MASLLTVQMRHRIGALFIDVDFTLDKPWTILFGPSGSGKSTILRAIAGLLHPDSTKIVSHPSQATEQVFVDTSRHIFLPAWRRGAPLVPQRPALFPHMTVAQNLHFGSPSGHSFPAATPTSLPALFQIEQFLQQHPRQLSGGEIQRVSIARATMARHHTLLLLDEAFTGLDTISRDGVMRGLRQWQQTSRTPILSVTHDIAEAFQLNAEVIKLHEGRVIAQGPVQEVLAQERQRLLERLDAQLDARLRLDPLPERSTEPFLGG